VQVAALFVHQGHFICADCGSHVIPGSFVDTQSFLEEFKRFAQPALP
jgi:hypothetical protein